METEQESEQDTVATLDQFERWLGGVIADHRCAMCGSRLGPAPRKQIDRRQFHSGCGMKYLRSKR